MHFHEKLHELKDKYEYTAHHIAECTGIYEGMIVFYLANRSKPTSKALFILAKFFNMTMDELYGEPTPEEISSNKIQKSVGKKDKPIRIPYKRPNNHGAQSMLKSPSPPSEDYVPRKYDRVIKTTHEMPKQRPGETYEEYYERLRSGV